MRLTPALVQAFIKALTDRLAQEPYPDFASYVIPHDQGRIDDGGGYGDPMMSQRPAFLQQVYDEMEAEGLVPHASGEERT